MKIKENVILEHNDGNRIRVVFHNSLSSIVYVIDLEGNRLPYPIEEDTLITKYDNKQLSIVNKDLYQRHVTDEEMTVAERERRERAWKIVMFVFQQLEGEQHVFVSKYREKAIQSAAATFQVNRNTVKNYLIRYWKGGKTRNALLPSFHLCGARGKKRKDSNIKRGRPNKKGKNKGINIDDRIKKLFKIGLNRYYYTQKEISLRTTYELIIKEFFTVEKVKENGKTVPLLEDSSKIPTYHQFYYWYKKFNNEKKEISKRKGERVYFQNFRPIVGDSIQDAGLGPGTLWQIDSTIFDIYLISSSNRNIIVGRPILFLVMDVYSRLIVGINISFESFNSYTGAMVALANSMTPKDDYCLQYGISLDEGEWDIACVPQRVFADRGELNGKQIEDAIENLGISIHNAPPYRGDAKGIIESAFAQMGMKVKPFADGIVKNGKNIVGVGEQDYRLKANITIEEFTKIIIKCVLFHNNHHVLSEYVLDEMMLEDDVEKIPRKIWEHGLKNKKGMLRVLPEDYIKVHLLPTDTGTITPRGLRYKKMYYISEYSLKNNWFESARINGSKRIKIWYDPRDLSNIYTMNEKENGFHKLTLVDHLTKYEGKAAAEIDQIIDYEKKIDDKSKEKELKEKIKLFDEIEDIIAKGKTKTEIERNPNLSKTERLRGIRENNKKEKERQRALLRENEQEEYNEEEVIVETNDDYDELALFRELMD